MKYILFILLLAGCTSDPVENNKDCDYILPDGIMLVYSESNQAYSAVHVVSGNVWKYMVDFGDGISFMYYPKDFGDAILLYKDSCVVKEKVKQHMRKKVLDLKPVNQQQ